MPTTYYGYYYPDASTSLTPLATVLAAMAASSDTAYKNTPAVFDTVAARDAAIPTPTDGRVVYTKDYDILWHYAGGWRPVGVPTFTNVTARDAAITSPAAGMNCVVGSGSTLAEYVHNGTSWVAIWSDTGWVTSGLTFTYPSSPNWTVNSYRLRKLGTRVVGVLNVVNAGAITADSAGNIGDQDICTPPAAWINGSGFPTAVRIDRAGVGSWFGRADSGGAIKITHGLPSATLPANTPCQVYIDYYTG